MDLNTISLIIGMLGGVVGLGSALVRSQNKIASNDVTHGLQIEELKTTTEANALRIAKLEESTQNNAVTLAAMAKDIHYISDIMRQNQQRHGGS